VMFTETEQLFGDQYGQIVVSLLPMEEGARDVDEIVKEMHDEVVNVIGASNISFLTLAGGPPTSKPISVKIRGDNYQTIEKARDALTTILKGIKGIKDIGDDAHAGRMELTLKMNHDAIRRAGISPIDITRTIRLLVDGEVVAEMQDKGEKLQIRVKAERGDSQDIGDLLNFRMPIIRDGIASSIPLNQLVTQKRQVSLGNIRHYNFKRAITLEANIEQLKEKEDFTEKEIIEYKNANASLFEHNSSCEIEFNIMPQLPYSIKMVFEDINGKKSKMNILDWEISQLFWTLQNKKKNDTEMKQGIKDKLNWMLEDRDLYL